MTEAKQTIEMYRLLNKRGDYKTNHILHVLLTLVTVGVWLPAWVLITFYNSHKLYHLDKKIEMYNTYTSYDNLR